MRFKDPTAWMDDFTVFIDDEELRDTAARLEPGLLYRGSKSAAAAWLSAVGAVAGGFGAVTLDPAIRASLTIFAAYLVAAALFLSSLRPATDYLLGRAMVWFAKTTVFWATLLAFAAVFAAGFHSAWLAYGLSAGGGLVLAIVHGSIAPSSVKNEDAWMMTALVIGPLSTIVATIVARNAAGDGGSIGVAFFVGSLAGGIYSVVTSIVLMRLWDEAHGLAHMAKLFLHNDNFAPKAIGYLDNAIALAPGDPRLYDLRGIAWSKLGESERAAADWERSVALQPLAAEPHMNRGIDHLRRGEIEAAVKTLGAALSIEPENATIHSNLGVALERRGDLEDAIKHYDRAIALRPDYPMAHANRAHTHFKRGDYDAALADCKRALDLEPQFAPALVNLGQVLAAMGERRAAAECYRTVMEMIASPELQQEAVRGLEALAADRVSQMSA